MTLTGVDNRSARLSSSEIENMQAAHDAASSVRAQLMPLLTRVEEALRRSRELLSLPIYPYDPAPAQRSAAGESQGLPAEA